MRLRLSHWSCHFPSFLHSHYIRPNPKARHKTHWYQQDRFTWFTGRFYHIPSLIFRFFKYKIKPINMYNESANNFKKDRVLLLSMPFKVGHMK